MIRSMTGFGQAEGTVGSSRVSVEVRTVNHRFFSPSIKLPNAFSRWETEVREAMRTRVSRGHVTLSARVERPEAGGVAIDERRFADVVAQLRGLQERHALDGGVDIGAVLRMPDVIALPREDESDAGTAAELVTIAEGALDALGVMREEEGGRLADILRARLEIIAAALGRIAERAPARIVAQRDRLRAAVRELADGVAIDESRLAQEIAILADRLDISEELDRFGSHITAFRATLDDSGSEPVGKRLGFLLQEMLREANTTGSKGADAAILLDVVTVKEELERVREQVENLE
ncbi:MAG: YicC/YloC family endoribonuclease [Gemmatimonadota bacterium]